MSALDNKVKIIDRSAFEEYRAKCVEDPDFRRKFHKERMRLQEENFDAFLKLSPPHKSVIEDVKKLIPFFDSMYILTGNKKDLIRKVLLAYGLDIILSKIFDADFMDDKKRKSKKAIIEHLISITNAKPKEIVFIEDQLSYLESVLDTGIKVFLVDWGFDNDENRKKAKAKGISLLNKSDFYEKIKQQIS